MEGDWAVFAICCRWVCTTCSQIGNLLLKVLWSNARKTSFKRNTVSSFALHSTVFFRLFLEREVMNVEL